MAERPTEAQIIREICQETCATYGEPACWKVDQESSEEFAPCIECEAGATVCLSHLANIDSVKGGKE